ncbi:HD domain-containing protein [Amycolatopsis rubida]|uniref:HD domain-containing protein n=1 Tax=Amycolatopsis rubida TaxID=112413 RepID=UPI000B876CCD|nr:HD domain-containing protein [Amycolatopsis rubida]
MDLVAWATHEAASHLAEVLPRRWAHVQGVSRRISVTLPLFPAETAEILSAAAILHDVGYAPSVVRTGFHSLDGAIFLQEKGAPDDVIRLVAHHSCAAAEAKIRNLSEQLASFLKPDQDLLDALSWADMTTTPDGKSTGVVDRINEIKARYAEGSPVSVFIHHASGELVSCVTRVERRLEEANLQA